MRRREFITLVCGAGAAWPLAAHAQQAGKLPTIGYLGDDASSWSPWTARFVERLNELGWNEGQNISIEYRWSEGHPERIAEIATEFVRRNVSVIITYGGAVAALKQATAAIPIVCSRSDRKRHRRQPFASWGQRNGLIRRAERYCWQEARAFA
jgi:putative ABC transport system substrate-binding protein